MRRGRRPHRHLLARRKTLYLLTGEVPFPVETEEAKVRAHVSEPPPRPSERVPGLGQAFDPIVARAMAKVPEQRYASAGQVGEAMLQAVRPPVPAPAPPLAETPPPAEPPRRATRPAPRAPAKCALLVAALSDRFNVGVLAGLLVVGAILGAIAADGAAGRGRVRRGRLAHLSRPGHRAPAHRAGGRSPCLSGPSTTGTHRRPRSSRRGSRPSAAARRSWSTATATGASRSWRSSRTPARSRSAGAPTTASRCPGTARSRACTRSSSRWAGTGSSSTTACPATGRRVNGDRITGRRRLRDGDRLVVGETSLRFHTPTDDASLSTASVRTGSAVLQPTETQRRVLVALCRPLRDTAYATPATNREIAEELHLSVDAVKAHLRLLFERLGIDQLPQNQKRARLAAVALVDGLVRQHELLQVSHARPPPSSPARRLRRGDRLRGLARGRRDAGGP